MDILAGRQVHDGVGPPQRRPGQLLDLFFNRGTDRGISDIRVHFNQKIAADDHRLDFRMVDVGRNDGATPRHLRADKLSGDFIGNLRAECLSRVLLARLTGLLELSASHVFANGDVFHLGRDNALAGIVQLGHVTICQSAPRLTDMLKTQMRCFHILLTRLAIGGTGARKQFSVLSLLDPRLPDRRQPRAQINRGVSIRVDARGVIDPDRWILFDTGLGLGGRQADLAHRHLEIGPAAFNVYLAGIGVVLLAAGVQSADFFQEVFRFCVHRSVLCASENRVVRRFRLCGFDSRI